MKRLILFLGAVLSIIFCVYALNNWRYETTDFSYLKATNRIVVSTHNVNDLGNEQELCEKRIVDDEIKVNAITSKIQTHTHGWQYEYFSPPWTGTLGRLSPILITFYKNEEIETILTIGYLDGFGYFLQQPLGLGKHLSVEELEDIINLIEIDKEVVDNQNPCN